MRAVQQHDPAWSASSEVPHGVEVVASQVTPDDARETAIAEALRREQKACLEMVPGGRKRNLKVIRRVERCDLEELLVPIYALRVKYSGSTFTGFVDGVIGTVSYKGPISAKRVMVAIGVGVLSVMLVIIAMLLLALGARRHAVRAEQEAMAQQERVDRANAERLENVRVELDEKRTDLAEALDGAADALKAGDASTAQSTLATVGGELRRFRDELGATQVADLWERHSALQTEFQRQEAFNRGIATAKEVVADKKRCNTPRDIADAWKDLRRVKSEDPAWRTAVGLTNRLEQCRLGAERDLTAGMRSLMVAQRQEVASRMERTFLEQGMDVRVRVQGRHKNQLNLTYVLFSRAHAYQMTDGGSLAKGSLLRNLQDAGFRKVVVSDGYDDSWTYTLEPEDEGSGGKTILAGLGLGEPLHLSQ
jgi:hypothetical protein